MRGGLLLFVFLSFTLFFSSTMPLALALGPWHFLLSEVSYLFALLAKRHTG